MSVVELEQVTGQRRGRLEALLKILAVDGAVARTEGGWTATGSPWEYDSAKYEALVQARRAEADLMRAYARGAGCLMEYLQRALDDPDPGPCGRCSVCTGELPAPGAAPTDVAIAAAREFLLGRDVFIEPRLRWPGGLEDRKGKITGCVEGRALAFADDAAWGRELRAFSAGDGPVSEAIADGIVQVLGRWRKVWGDRPVAVVPMPSRAHPQRVRSLAEHLAQVGKLPLLDVLEATGPPVPTEVSSTTRAGALLGSIRVRDGSEVPNGPVLLVDDTYRTGWTATVAAALLRDAGAIAVLPIVVHRLP
jgi:ATP-dependent DNA helicase RecQ